MKEKDKVLIAKLILKITIIMTIVSVFIKLLGFDLFEADYSNKILLWFSNLVDNNFVSGLFSILLIFIQLYIIYRITTKNSCIKTHLLVTSISTLIIVLTQIYIFDYMLTSKSNLISILYAVISLINVILCPFLIDYKVEYKIKYKRKNNVVKFMQKFWVRIKKPLIMYMVVLSYQIIVLFIRNLPYNSKYETIYNFLLNFDYIIILLITYYIYLKRKDNLKINSVFNFSLAQFLNEKPDKKDIKYFVIQLKNGYADFKKQNKTDKIVVLLYLLFFIIQECLTLGLLIYIASINDYIIECLFILTSFIISKSVFGAFHFKSFILCFFVSNLSFFILSRLTMNVNTTFIIPIFCGILLAYISSRFINKSDSSLYRGVPVEKLEKICDEKKLNKMEKDILIDYYSNRYNIDKLAIKYHYSDRSIQRIKTKALNKIQL